MADKTSSKSNTLAFPPTSAAAAGRGRRKSLIEWDDPSKPAHVLDWRQPAHEFGLEVDEREETDEEQPFAVAPERLLRDDEPEAFADQRLAVEEEVEEEEIEQPEEGASREDVDLVRLYLQHIGKARPLEAARGGHTG